MVDAEPDVDYFKPRGVRLRELEEVDLSVDELEALRLKDFKGLSQKEVAKRMGVSQPSLHRLLASARKKVSEALVTGKAIKIHGGDYSVRKNR